MERGGPIVSDVRFEHCQPGHTLGLPYDRPRLSWKFYNVDSAFQQAAYEVEVCAPSTGTGMTLLCCRKVNSSQSQLVPWPHDEALISRQEVSVRVRIWSCDGSSSPWSQPATFETGLLTRADWHCQRIAAPGIAPTAGHFAEQLFRKAFWLRSRVRRARLYVTAQGLYQAEINGQQIGDFLAPGWTNYNHRILHQTYDVTHLLTRSPEENCIGLRLAEGWFSGRLEIVYDDQSSERICTDKTWLTTAGPATAAEIYDGEKYDGTAEIDGWSQPGNPTHEFDPALWREVGEKPPLSDTIQIVPDFGAPGTRKQTIAPVQKIITPCGKVVLDFGQNLVGYVRIKAVKGKRGDRISLEHAEVMENNELGRRPLRICQALDQYTLKGTESGEQWEPRFTFHGFRYCQVDGWPVEAPELQDSLVAVVCHSEMEPIGHFRCSDKMLNKLHENTVWSMKGNFLSIPTDCPQRDERLGWTGDIALFAPSAAKLYDCYSFLQNWLVDVVYEQDLRGGIPPLVPPNAFQGLEFWGDPWPCSIWHDVTIRVPWALYVASGDQDILARNYGSMKTWLTQIPRDMKTTTANRLWDRECFQLGDWLDPSAPPDKPATSQTDATLVADAFLVHSMDLVCQIAEVLGDTEGARVFEAEAHATRQQFVHEYISASGRVVSDSQTAYALTICFDLLPTAAQRANAGERLAKLVRQEHFKINTGFAGSPFICEALVRVGHAAVAYAMLLNRECPSWLYPVTMGATTTWERWDSMLPDGSINPGEMTSFNHYSHGAVISFLHERLAGLRCVEPGWKKSRAAPVISGGITGAEVSYNTPYGKVGCSWSIEGEQFTLTVEVPPTTTMEVVLPAESGGRTELVKAGKWTFSGRHRPDRAWPVTPISKMPWAEG
ncbi:uncharacterized protein Z519_04984 [Cladophialophora bantiana CBS 173.52]|uniref:alpha-L-rhamnosidase n=1 Tax=Cladophialophora bantiana (strain ATCC 10958 / CBS 173.52 / CDC B-1940 / NIH 8579) TaxID=1442370 RepID=A0A0D2IE30_CLAB1|nr:uncharacterized protein Z519_04984 [Cladophialophora bantiana CBS 173.52]KIW95004.1 hypothetical protein Z519_04984 [Cladophialophora bantiana CBS 173.52]